jgi:hypothetical protein
VPVGVPPYCTSRQGKVFRVVRSSELVAPDRVRYTLRAEPIALHVRDGAREIAREFDTTLVRDKIALGQAIPTPEDTFEELWQQLRLDLDVGYS